MSTIKGWFAQLRGARGLPLMLALALACALLLLAFSDRGMPASTDSGGSATEARLEAVLSRVEGAGRVQVLIREKAAQPAFSQGTAGALPDIEGVVVVAEGADNLRVQLELARAVKALLGVEMERIEVLKMGRSGGG